MRTAVLQGRGISERDSANSQGVAVVSEAFARQHFPSTNPIGQFLTTKARVGPGKPGDSRDLEIVGVARDTNGEQLRREPYPTVYVSYAQLNGNFPLTLEVRANGSLTGAAAVLRSVLQPSFRNTTIEVRPLSAQVEAQMAQERLLATLASGFAALALVLACVGLYGLLAYGVARSTKEIGIRMSLGAQPKRVVLAVLRGAASLTFLGIVFGLPGAWAASHWIQTMLFGLTPTDPVAIGAAVVLLIACALVAAWLPARRASRVDPMTALRHE
jgi:ABC-type antimicrobial peptide transport system permease subunit